VAEGEDAVGMLLAQRKKRIHVIGGEATASPLNQTHSWGIPVSQNEASWDRIARILLGVILIAVGVFAVQGVAGVVLAVVGLIPLVTGAMGGCPIYAIFKTGTHKPEENVAA
jgi:hypothetical protein